MTVTCSFQHISAVLIIVARDWDLVDKNSREEEETAVVSSSPA